MPASRVARPDRDHDARRRRPARRRCPAKTSLPGRAEQRHALPGEHRLVDREVVRLGDAQVGADPVAGLEQHEVVRRTSSATSTLQRLAVAAHRARARHQRAAAAAAARSALCSWAKANTPLSRTMTDDRHGQRRHARHQGEDRSHPQHAGEEVRQLGQHQPPGRGATGRRHRVGTVAARAAGRLLRPRARSGREGRWSCTGGSGCPRCRRSRRWRRPARRWRHASRCRCTKRQAAETLGPMEPAGKLDGLELVRPDLTDQPLLRACRSRSSPRPRR